MTTVAARSEPGAPRGCPGSSGRRRSCAIDEHRLVRAPRQRLDPDARRSRRTGRGTLAPSTRAPRLAKSPSRAMSDTGRVPGGTGPSRVPFAAPAMTRTIGEPSGRPRPMRLRTGTASRSRRRTAGSARRAARGARRSPGSSSTSANARARARCTRSTSSASRASLQVGHPRLPRVEQGALPAQPEVLVRQLEPVGGRDHRVDPRSGLVVRRHRTRRRARRCDGVRPAADPPAQLMELREPEALGVLDEHHRRVRHVDPDLDHGRRDRARRPRPRGRPPSSAPCPSAACVRGAARPAGRGRPRSRAARPRPPPPSPGCGCPHRSRRRRRTPAVRPRPRARTRSSAAARSVVGARRHACGSAAGPAAVSSSTRRRDRRSRSARASAGSASPS